MEEIMAAPKVRAWQQTAPSYRPEDQTKVKVKVRKSGWITKGEKLLYSIAGVYLVSMGIYVVSFSSSTDTLNRELQQLENKVQTQQVNNEGLSFEVSELSRPERITKIAKENGLKIQDAKVKQASVSVFNE